VALAARRPREARANKIDPARLSHPWNGFVLDALRAKTNFDRTVASAREGPMQERLQYLGGRIADAVQECWSIACQGNDLEAGLRSLDPRAVHTELEQVERERQSHRDPATQASLGRTADALRSQLSSAERISNVARDAANRLRVLNAQLDEAVARAIELSLRTGDAGALSPLSADVESLVSEMEHLRHALEEA
jgi:hypothetical protein